MPRAHHSSVCGFLVFGFRSPLIPLICFITVLMIICVSLCCFTDEEGDPYAVRTHICNLELGVYISQLIRFTRASSNLNDFNYRHKALTAKLLRQGYRYFKLRKAFPKFYRRHSALVEKYSVSLKILLQQGISESDFTVT